MDMVVLRKAEKKKFDGFDLLLGKIYDIKFA